MSETIGWSEAAVAMRPAEAPAASADTSNRKNMILLIQLRWIAVAGQVATIAAVEFGLGIRLPISAMVVVLAGLVALNIASLAWLGNRAEVDERGLFVALILDVAALTGQLYLSGGATNPFVFLYILQATLAAVLLRPRQAWGVVVATGACFAGLTLFNQPLQLPPGSASLFDLHIAGMLVCFVLDAALLVVFVSRITRNLRERDAYLAALRQRAAEEGHIVRMGLLASGAAHELGTPLSSVSVILGDWKHMPALAADPELAQELGEMQAAIDRCKSILSGVLQSAGEARGDSPTVTTVSAFLDGIVADWQMHQPAARLRYKNAFGADLAIVSDTALKQVVFNVLDNAFEVSPKGVGLTAERRGEMLELRVADSGPGFAPEMLSQFGKPYASTKGRPGSGLGLFLVVNVVRKLGGTVTARNRMSRGALVTIELPLAMLTLRDSGRG